MFDGCRILIVDDNKDSCEIMSLILMHSNESYIVTLAHSAREAQDLIEKNDFDLFVLDNRLPDSSGTQLCEWIRQRDKETSVIFYSGLSGEIFQKEAEKAGADEYLVKPDDLDDLADVVYNNLNECLRQQPAL